MAGTEKAYWTFIWRETLTGLVFGWQIVKILAKLSIMNVKRNQVYRNQNCSDCND
jgi:hypothetical protein